MEDPTDPYQDNDQSIIVGIDYGSKDHTAISVMRGTSDGRLVILDDLYPSPEGWDKVTDIVMGSMTELEERIYLFMAGHDVKFTHVEEIILQQRMHQSLLNDRSLGSYKLNLPPEPKKKKHKDFAPLHGKKLAKALEKRAKAKAHRKASRK